jgi:hypothetical protein
VEADRLRADDYYLAEGTGVADRYVASEGRVQARGTLDGDAYESWVAGHDPDTGAAKGRLRTDAQGVRFVEVVVNGPKSWSLAPARAGLARLTPHELRHTAASLAVAAGANVKAVQRMLGHGSAAMTLDVYAGLFDDDLDGLADRLDAVAVRASADNLRTTGQVAHFPGPSVGL